MKWILKDFNVDWIKLAQNKAVTLCVIFVINVNKGVHVDNEVLSSHGSQDFEAGLLGSNAVWTYK